jgi:hypothetical protein
MKRTGADFPLNRAGKTYEKCNESQADLALGKAVIIARW